MVCNLPPTQPGPFQSILTDLQNKIDGLPEGYRETIQADFEKLSAVLRCLPPAAAPAGVDTPIEQVLDSLIAGVVVLDQAGVVRMANDYAVWLFGFDPLGMRHDNLLIRLKAVGPDGKRVPDEHMPSSRAALGEVVPNQALTITVPHGRTYHVLVSAMPLFSGSQVSGVACILNDVTGLHNLDEESRQQRELLETVLNSSPFGLAILSGPDLTYRYTNRAFRGLSPDLADPAGRPLRSVWRSEERYLRARARIDQTIASGETIYTPQEPIEQPDGTLRYFSTHIVRITWEKEPAALVIIWDVTEMVAAKTSLQQRAVEFQAIFEAITDPVLVFNAAGVPERTNWASIQAFGFDATGINRRELIRRLRLHHPDGNPMRVEELLSSRVLSGQPVRDLPMRFQDAQGRTRIVLGTGSPLLDADGQISGAVAIWRDVTEQERASS